MQNIHVLDPHVADLIAAGEVVERPASVVKELVENAVDAGAAKVTVEIARGGMTFLRVTDDGGGIPAGELKTAFLRHATSKLRTERDLEAIGTLGFRGEALAAIAAVSRVEVLTRTAQAPLGAALRLEGGQPGEVEEAGCPLGTTMVVRDLFYNTPARLKFMKKDAAEGAAVFAVVQRLALSHPEVSVKFIRDGKQELLTPGDGKLQSAVYAVLGRELALGFRPVKSTGEDLSVTGFVSLPACCRASRSWQFFFVNGRQVKSPLMMAALEEAYKNQRMVGKYPGCVLHLETRLSAVDVNVHPAKTEVKFGAERQVFSAIYHAVLSALEGDRSHPAMELNNERLAGMPAQDTVTPNQVRLSPAAAAAAVQVQDMAAPRPPKTPVFQLPRTQYPAPARPGREPAARPAPEPGVREGQEAPRAACLPPERPEPQDTPAPISDQASPAWREDPAQQSAARLEQLSHPAAPAQAGRAGAGDPDDSGAPGPIDALFPQEESWRVAGEVLNTYLIVERGETVYFIDKHAAHERMNFDRMKAQGYEPMAQTLLSPVVCRLGVEERAVLLAHRPLLEEFGFDVDELGRELAVRQVPDHVDAGDVEATLAEIARKLLATGSADPAAARDELLHTMACKAAIKGGWKTSPQELERVAQAVMDGSVKYCPHGRPVAIELTRKELEKQFRRA